MRLLLDAADISDPMTCLQMHQMTTTTLCYCNDLSQKQKKAIEKHKRHLKAAKQIEMVENLFNIYAISSYAINMK